MLLWGYWAWCYLVVRDIPELVEIEGVPGVLVPGIHCILATSGVDLGDAI